MIVYCVEKKIVDSVFGNSTAIRGLFLDLKDAWDCVEEGYYELIDAINNLKGWKIRKVVIDQNELIVDYELFVEDIYHIVSYSINVYEVRGNNEESNND